MQLKSLKHRSQDRQSYDKIASLHILLAYENEDCPAISTSQNGSHV